VDFGLRRIASNTGHGLALADYDEDGRLDLGAVGGNVGLSSVEPGLDAVSIYRNTLDIPTNQPPGAPSALTNSVGPGTVLLSWTNALDDITPENLLTYNVCITTVPKLNATNESAPLSGSSYTNLIKVSPMANFITGKRKVAEPGNVGHAYHHPYRLPPGTYYWSVQAIDGAYAGGPWAPEQTFTITDPELPDLSIAHAGSAALLSWSGRFPDFSLEYQDTLLDSTWVTNTLAVTFTNNGKANVIYTNPPPTKFFRLRK
jgi:hypothetical protein